MAFIADDLYEIRWPDGRRELVPIQFTGEAAMKRRTVKTADSQDDELARALEKLERITAELERRPRRTFDAGPRLRADAGAIAAQAFMHASRRFHRRHVPQVGEDRSPASAVRTVDAGENEAERFERLHREQRTRMLAAQPGRR